MERPVAFEQTHPPFHPLYATLIAGVPPHDGGLCPVLRSKYRVGAQDQIEGQ